MNTSHFPDLERCKKLTEAAFPKTEKLLLDENGDFTIKCPSVSELLDEMPDEYIDIPKYIIDWNPKGIYRLHIFPREFTEYGGNWQVEYSFDGAGHYHRGTIPNALADMYIWLKANNYLP